MGDESNGSYRIFLTGRDESLRKEFQDCLSKIKLELPLSGDPILLQLCAVQCIESVNGAGHDAIIFLLDYFSPTCCMEVAQIYSDLRGSTGFGYLGFVCGSKNPAGSLDERAGIIEKTIKIEEDLWEKPLQLEIQQLKRSNSTKANQERIKQLIKWAESDKIVYHISRVNFCDKKDSAAEDILKAYKRFVGASNLTIRTTTSFSIQKVPHKSSTSLPLKAPALHWTNWPLPEELQVTWRFRFLCGEPPESWFNHVIKECSQKSLSCDYIYQWIDGLFLLFDSVKICVERDKNNLDVSARCDPEEMGESSNSATNLLWHYIAPFLHAVFLSFENYLRIPYQILLVPIGNVFFSPPISVETTFDLTTVLSAIERQKYHGFKMNSLGSSDSHTSSDRTFFIERCLPGFRPHTVSDLQSHLRTLATHSKATRKASHPVVSLSSEAARTANLLNVQETDNSQKRRRSLDSRRVSFGHVLIEDPNKTDQEKEGEELDIKKMSQLSTIND